MKLIIKIPEWYYEETKEFKHPTLIDKAIINGVPCEPCEDCISRTETLNEICIKKCGNEYSECKFTEPCTYCKVIANMPSVQPIRPKGKWLKSDIGGSMLQKCSVCGWQLGAYTHRYCAMCGADMRGANES